MNARIHTIMFDADERPLGAVIFTSRGIVEAVRNQDGWTMLGAPAAKKLALPAIRRVERWPAPIMHEVEQRLKLAGCPKMNLMVRNGNDAVLAFYVHLGYVVEDSVALGKRLIHDVQRDL